MHIFQDNSLERIFWSYTLENINNCLEITITSLSKFLNRFIFNLGARWSWTYDWPAIFFFLIWYKNVSDRPAFHCLSNLTLKLRKNLKPNLSPAPAIFTRVRHALGGPRTVVAQTFLHYYLSCIRGALWSYSTRRRNAHRHTDLKCVYAESDENGKIDIYI